MLQHYPKFLKLFLDSKKKNTDNLQYLDVNIILLNFN